MNFNSTVSASRSLPRRRQTFDYATAGSSGRAAFLSSEPKNMRKATPLKTWAISRCTFNSRDMCMCLSASTSLRIQVNLFQIRIVHMEKFSFVRYFQPFRDAIIFGSGSASNLQCYRVPRRLGGCPSTKY